MPATPIVDSVTPSSRLSPRPLLLNTVKSKEQCPNCLELFDIVELISHVNSCLPCLTDEVEEEDHCQFCLKLFPVSHLVSHAVLCTERKKEIEKTTEVFIDSGILWFSNN